MAYKTIQQSLWTDPKFKNLDINSRYLFLYLITNPQAHHSGLYYMPDVLISAQSGLSGAILSKSKQVLIKENLIMLDENLELIWVINMAKHQLMQGNRTNIISGITKHLKGLHQSYLIGEFLNKYNELSIPSEWYVDTISNPSVTDTDTVIGTDTDKSLKSNKCVVPYDEIISDLNEKADKNYRASTPKTQSVINSRWAEGFRLDDFKLVNTHQVARWKNNPKMNRFIRPETIYGNKFEGYLNSPPSLSEQGVISENAEKSMLGMEGFLNDKSK